MEILWLVLEKNWTIPLVLAMSVIISKMLQPLIWEYVVNKLASKPGVVKVDISSRGLSVTNKIVKKLMENNKRGRKS